MISGCGFSRFKKDAWRLFDFAARLLKTVLILIL